MGADCKSAGSAFSGSNPLPTTSLPASLNLVNGIPLEFNNEWMVPHLRRVLGRKGNQLSDIGIGMIVEAGNRDYLDAIRLHELFNDRVISFEPDSKAFRICGANFQKFGKLQNQI